MPFIRWRAEDIFRIIISLLLDNKSVGGPWARVPNQTMRTWVRFAGVGQQDYGNRMSKFHFCSFSKSSSARHWSRAILRILIKVCFWIFEKSFAELPTIIYTDKNVDYVFNSVVVVGGGWPHPLTLKRPLPLHSHRSHDITGPCCVSYSRKLRLWVKSGLQFTVSCSVISVLVYCIA